MPKVKQSREPIVRLMESLSVRNESAHNQARFTKILAIIEKELISSWKAYLSAEGHKTLDECFLPASKKVGNYAAQNAAAERENDPYQLFLEIHYRQRNPEKFCMTQNIFDLENHLARLENRPNRFVGVRLNQRTVVEEWVEQKYARLVYDRDFIESKVSSLIRRYRRWRKSITYGDKGDQYTDQMVAPGVTIEIFRKKLPKVEL